MTPHRYSCPVRLLPWRWYCLAVALILPSVTLNAGEKRILREGLTIDGVGRAGRSAVHTDAIEASLVAGKWRPPAAGDKVSLPNGSTREWQTITADEENRFEVRGGRGAGSGYVYVPVAAEQSQILILEASGHSLVYVNGEPRVGDVYGAGYVHLPVLLNAGTNDLLFLSGRGQLKAALATPSAPVTIDLADPTLPDLVAGQKMDTWGAVLLVNATAEPQRGLRIRAHFAGGRAIETPVPVLLPLSARKVAFRIRGEAPRSGDKATLQLALVGKTGGRRAQIHSAESSLRVRLADQTQKRTFRSDIDGSVQYWALNPARPIHRNDPLPALFLSLHGASVEALGQADAYSPKSWGHIAAPTNRRPYGFDWEAWGRLDALEVLHLAKSELHPDPQRIYLTGHSMGGHGTWHLGVLFPDQFAAIGPSAGWISLTSYAGADQPTNATPIEKILQRAGSVSDTLALKTNYLHEGIYVLHGDADDNVPVTQARRMREELKTFHADVASHEQPGAGHWWDASDEPGADCVDWAPLFDFFAHHVIPADDAVRQVNFATANPGVSATCHWLTIAQQLRQLEVSSASVRWDPARRRFSGTTENVGLLQLSLHHALANQPLNVELDGQKLNPIPWPVAGRLWLRKDQNHWRLDAAPAVGEKQPQRYGPFKEAFNRRMLFVYATQGTPEENSWARAKARFDAETFWYRGNGSIDVIPDSAFDPRAEPDRSVILYGNADSNLAWPALLGTSPVRVRRGEIRIGERGLPGEDQACLFVRPRPGSAVACVGVVTGTGINGCRLADRLNFFLSGAAYPDCTVVGPEMLSQGSSGVRAAGYFGLDWSVDRGEFAWREAP